MKGETLVSLTALNAANQRAQDAETQCDIMERECHLLQSKVEELTEALQNKEEGATWLEHPDWMAIRARFFKECVDRKTEYYPEFGDVRKVSLAPHDLFEWFKSQLTQKEEEENGDESGGYYYELFKFFSDEHGLTLVDSEIEDIIRAVEKFNNHPVRRIINDNWDGRCKCGHLHSEHRPVNSVNYSAGRCTVGECRCAHFINYLPKQP